MTSDGHGANTLTSKDTNPKDAVAVAHLKFSALPVRVLAGVALALSEGAWKYGRHNYRVAGVNASVYFDACIDHLFAWWEGEDIDPDSGRHHIDKAIAGLFVLRDAMLGDKCTDDRPPAVTPGWIAEGHAETAALFERMREKYPTPCAPFVNVSVLPTVYETALLTEDKWSGPDARAPASSVAEALQRVTEFQRSDEDK